MREIKFRAWDRKAKKMFPVHVMSWGEISNNLDYVRGVDIHDKDSDFHGNVMYGGSVHKMTGNPLQQKFEVMQCTGLQDKNGVEIYEGDIVQLYGDFDEGMLPYHKATVTFSNGCFCIDDPFEYGEDVVSISNWVNDHSGEMDEIEVIGNVLQHPHLLDAAMKAEG